MYPSEDDFLIGEFIRKRPDRNQYPLTDEGDRAYNTANAAYVEVLRKLSKKYRWSMSNVRGKVCSED